MIIYITFLFKINANYITKIPIPTFIMPHLKKFTRKDILLNILIFLFYFFNYYITKNLIATFYNDTCKKIH